MTTTQPHPFLVPSTKPISFKYLLDRHGELQSRDHWAIRMIAEHRALTTAQFTALGFSDDPATTAKRLKILTRRGWLDRFGAGLNLDGSIETAWCLGPLGTAYVKPAGQDPVTPAYADRQKERLLRDPQLDTLLDTNQFFADLADHARTHQATDLRFWWSPRTCRQITASTRHQTWHGEYLHHQRRHGFWLEPDNDTIRPASLAAHIHRYHPIAARTQIPTVLFRSTDQDRETELREHLERLNLVGLYVATTHPDLGRPATAVWQPIGRRERVALHELPETDLAYHPDDGCRRRVKTEP